MTERHMMYRVAFVAPYGRTMYMEIPITHYGDKRQDGKIADKEIRLVMAMLSNYIDIDEGYEIISITDYIG